MTTNNTEPVPTPTIYEVLLDCYHAGSMSQRGKTIHPGTVEEWERQIERICASERQDEVFRVPLYTAVDLAMYKVRRRVELQTLIEEPSHE